METVVETRPQDTDLSQATISRHPLVERDFSLVGNYLIALSQSASGTESQVPIAYGPAGAIRQLLVACTSLGGSHANAEALQLAAKVCHEVSTSTGVLGPGLAERNTPLERIFAESIELLTQAARE